MLSIITPHKDDIEGIKSLKISLKIQTSEKWFWIIVDDGSSIFNKSSLQEITNGVENIKVIYNETNLGPSISRNKGVDSVVSSNMVFLDSDDFISPKFVENRIRVVDDFVVYANLNIVDKERTFERRFSNIKTDFLKSFSMANFPWQTTAILWNKIFFEKIGGFNPNLKLLEDIEVSILALHKSKNHLVLIDNEVDFYYLVKPINYTKRPFFLVKNSVELLVKNLCNDSTFPYHKELVNYYFLAVRYFIKDKKANINDLKNILLLFKNKKIISSKHYYLGCLTFILLPVLKNNFFLRINRKIFKQL